MSPAAPVPPQPPPPPSLSSSLTNIQKDQISVPVNRIPNDECSWALDYPELQKGCFLSRVCQYAQPKRCQFYAIPSFLQVGPTCGLTALSMLLNGQPTATELLADAIAQKYTINGEMFSAQYLYELTRKHLDSADACLLHEGLLDCARIEEQLIAGACLLVPYDADVNHAPCLKSGHRAHWALIVGYLIDDQDKFFVVARHGKTRSLAIWSLVSLSESNANLVEFAQPKGHEGCTFLLPPGGIDGALGLKERSILITAPPHQLTQVR
ncbi:actin maturation protease [Drosophila virilis]|uniref:Actin maturation protease n=1 Tax=Drosophila virilis TaxID=7244 RepID=B4M0H4_DROVI|nr:UPF0692 protein CG33108 [Drosophila virilis]EDW68353.1 uncharacterized protein Dvir_GJ24658 [Drosophila virilis]